MGLGEEDVEEGLMSREGRVEEVGVICGRGGRRGGSRGEAMVDILRLRLDEERGIGGEDVERDVIRVWIVVSLNNRRGKGFR